MTSTSRLAGAGARLRRWLLTGIGRSHDELCPTAEDLAAFDTFRRATSVGRVRALTALMLAFNLAFWPTDEWLLGHLPGVVSPLAEGRAVVSLFAVTVLVVSFVPRSLQIAAGWYTLLGLAGIVGWTLGRMGGPDTPWLHHGYPFVFFGLVAWMAPAHRMVITFAAGAVLGVSYFSPGHQAHPTAGTAIANLGYITALATAIGLYLDHMRLRVFLLQRGRMRQIEHLDEQVAAQTRRIQSLLDHVESVRERERAEIAADLHDEMGQVLTAMRCVLKVARERARAGVDTIATDLEQLGLLLQHCTRSLRAVLARLRPQVLDDLGLDAAAEWLVERIAGAAELEYTVELPGDGALARLPTESATAVFRIIQESLTNVVRHAGASKLGVRLAVSSGELRLHIEDDGVGFDGAVEHEGLGILGMFERARALGGQLEVRSDPGHGTSVQLSLRLESGA